MIYIGIDVASEKHDCCFLTDDKQVLLAFTFSNSAEGFRTFYEALTEHTTPENRKIGLEATGIYGNNLQEFMRRKRVEFSTINPLLLKHSTKATTLRKTKTDKIDAKTIALFLQDPRRTYQPDLPISYHISELKSLTRLRSDLVKSCSRSKNQAKGLLHTLFPEFHRLFSDVFGASGIAVLKRYPSAKSVSRAHTSILTELLKKASRGRFDAARANALKELAKESIGIDSKAKEVALQICLDTITFFTYKIKAIENEIKAYMDRINSPITTIPGIGNILGAIILAEIGDVKNFTSPAKLLSFAGCEPSIYESGKFKAGSGHMVKHGSSYLRYAVIMAARVASRSSRTFSIYMDKKISEGKHYNVASTHCAKKMIRIIYTILNKNISFDDNYSVFTT
ncbi:MAG: IS110 family transposase [Oscillospiraceae bacterium]|nr:IS110 family transposase [Oscillospiraceae bacterium]